MKDSLHRLRNRVGETVWEAPSKHRTFDKWRHIAIIKCGRITAIIMSISRTHIENKWHRSNTRPGT